MPVELSFFGGEGQVPSGVAMLLAALGGALIVAVPGSTRIIQLRRAAKAARRERPASADPTHTSVRG